MRFTLTIESEDDAFVGDPRSELAAILSHVTEKLDRLLFEDRSLVLRDSNGNRCGTVEVKT